MLSFLYSIASLFFSGLAVVPLFFVYGKPSLYLLLLLKPQGSDLVVTFIRQPPRRLNKNKQNKDTKAKQNHNGQASSHEGFLLLLLLGLCDCGGREEDEGGGKEAAATTASKSRSHQKQPATADVLLLLGHHRFPWKALPGILSLCPSATSLTSVTSARTSGVLSRPSCSGSKPRSSSRPIC